MPVAVLNDLELYYERFGDPSDQHILLIMGLARQLTGWDQRFCRRLADHGFCVIRYDHRDVGLSTHLPGPGPDLLGVLRGDGSSVPYSLEDLADDATALLDCLGVERAHVVGASMGAMVAQLMAIRRPQRLRSLVSIMGSTGDPLVGMTSPVVTAALANLGEAGVDRSRTIDGNVALAALTGSPEHRLPERTMRRFFERDFDRAHHPVGAERQLAAVAMAPDRTTELKKLELPTLVIHGADDPFVDVSGGVATAQAVPNAELLIVQGMGHDLPYPLWPRLIDAIVGNARRPV